MSSPLKTGGGCEPKLFALVVVTVARTTRFAHYRRGNFAPCFASLPPATEGRGKDEGRERAATACQPLTGEFGADTRICWRWLRRSSASAAEVADPWRPLVRVNTHAVNKKTSRCPVLTSYNLKLHWQLKRVKHKWTEEKQDTHGTCMNNTWLGWTLADWSILQFWFPPCFIISITLLHHLPYVTPITTLRAKHC